jgi:HK97 gp10 family phage protein
MMTNSFDITLLGDKELMSVLTNLPYKVQHKVLKRVVNDAANPMVKEIRANTPVGPTGNLKKSIGKKAGRSKKSAVVFVGPRIGGKSDASMKGYVANILEHSKGRVRKPKGKLLSTPWGPRRFVRGFPARPFVRPAMKRSIKTVENNMFTSLRKIIQKELNKVRK